MGEMLTLSFFLGPIALAAVTAAIVALAGGGVALQWIVFTAVSRVPARAAADRPPSPAHARAAAHRHRGAGRRHRGRDRPRGSRRRHRAVGGRGVERRSYDEDYAFEPGARVEVLKIDGATALVHE